MTRLVPSHSGLGLSNLVAEVEARLTGRSRWSRLDADVANTFQEAASYVLVLFDGLGHSMLTNPRAAELAGSARAVLHAPFPTTTTVAMATVATGLPPAAHGVIGHLMWLPGPDRVVNVLKWIDQTGSPVPYDTERFLPSPNVWERLSAAGIEPITVQPGDFSTSPLTRALYRGCRFEPVYSVSEAIEATVRLAETPGRLVFTYFPEIDFASHVYGQESPEYERALAGMDNAWSALTARRPDGVTVIGTADHGHIDYPESAKLRMRDRFDALTSYGDPRSVYLRGDTTLIEDFAAEAGSGVIGRETLLDWWSAEAGTHPELTRRAPEAAVLAPDGAVLLPRGFDRRLRGYHGGLDRREVEIPLLVSD